MSVINTLPDYSLNECEYCKKLFTRYQSLCIHKCKWINMFYAGQSLHLHFINGFFMLDEAMRIYSTKQTEIEVAISKGQLYHVICKKEDLHKLSAKCKPISHQQCECHFQEGSHLNHIHYIGYNALSNNNSRPICTGPRSFIRKKIRNIGHFIQTVIYIQRGASQYMKISKVLQKKHKHVNHTWSPALGNKYNSKTLIEMMGSLPEEWKNEALPQLDAYIDKQKAKLQLAKEYKLSLNIE